MVVTKTEGSLVSESVYTVAATETALASAWKSVLTFPSLWIA